MGALGLAVGAATLAGGYAVGAARPSAFTPAGVTRYALVSQGAPQMVTLIGETFVDLPGMAVTIEVPPQRTADVIVTFSGVARTCSKMIVRAMVGDDIAHPGPVQLAVKQEGNEARSFTFWETVGKGVHRVGIQWRGVGFCTSQRMYARTMVVTANIH
jgi:hypothetical protein